MDNVKHTPGPWITERCDTGIEILNTEQESVAVACHFGNPYSSIREEANAKLIAAAPDLLKALEKMSVEFATHKDESSNAAHAWHLAQQAIAKATE